MASERSQQQSLSPIKHRTVCTGLSCLLVVVPALLAIGCGGSTAPTSGGGSPPSTPPALAAGIHPLTPVNASANTGYFEDPLPIHQTGAAGSYLPSIAGTTHQILDCTTLAASCYTPSTLTITTGDALTSQLPANTQLKGYQNNNVYQDNAGNWQMATTVTVNNPSANPNGLPWNVILHASPVSGSATSANGVPLSWTADTLLVGSFTTQANANYDGKYIEDNGTLYLIYSQRLQPSPAQDGIVAQSMVSATQLSSSPPAPLLAPENNSDGGYKSELFDCASTTNQFKLIETGNISVVNGKYAMAYSTGSYETPCYKVGIAWSDSLIGPYKKVLQSDTNNIWQNPAAESEVVYLIQSLQSAWPQLCKFRSAGTRCALAGTVPGRYVVPILCGL